MRFDQTEDEEGGVIDSRDGTADATRARAILLPIARLSCPTALRLDQVLGSGVVYGLGRATS